jgi:hypothetical protein
MEPQEHQLERVEREKIDQQFLATEIKTAAEIAVKYEVELSYKNIPWNKGLVLLEEMRKLGYKITKI